jgi:hypothetical protein
MVEQLIKTIKQGLIIMVVVNISSWDLLLLHILFECCGIQANIKYSPFMVLTRRTPRLTIDNNLTGLCDVFNEFVGPKVMVEQMV